MNDILYLAHTEPDGTLAKPQLEALHTARRLASELDGARWTAGVVGAAIEPAARVISGSRPARCIGVSSPELARGRYATDAIAVETIARASDPTLVIAAGTSRWARVLPGVAHRIGGRADTHVTACTVANGTLRAHRWFYRQRMEAVLQRSHRPWFLLIEPGTQPAWTGSDGAEPVELLSPEFAGRAGRTTFMELRAPADDARTIRPDADLLFVAGAGWTKKQADGRVHAGEAEELIRGFLKRTRASLGSSKSLVDLGGEGQPVLPFLTHLNQVGQTGSTPRHPKGLATCCHGEEPHTVGWRFVKERRAINLDPNCGWARGKADVLYVADAFAVLASVNAQLDRKRSGT
jgi:electron transfer flavoprotein alpha subunit